MNSFWINLYDRAKDRRYAAFFFTALAAFGGIIAAVAVLYPVVRALDRKYWIPVLVGIGSVVCRLDCARNFSDAETKPGAAAISAAVA